MKKQFFLLSSLSIILAACTNSTQPNAANTGEQTTMGGEQTENENESDRMLTQRIRQAIMEDNSLSPNAKNIRVATSNGVVTLRGTVSSDKEKNEIGKKVNTMNGVKSVNNQLEVNRSEGSNVMGMY